MGNDLAVVEVEKGNIDLTPEKNATKTGEIRKSTYSGRERVLSHGMEGWGGSPKLTGKV